MFKAQSPERKIFDTVRPESRFKRWGPLTMFKPIIPNLLPIPLFIAGSFSSRALVTSKDFDLAGDSFMVDSSFLWIDSLALPDTKMAILAGVLGFASMRLSMVGVRADNSTKRLSNERLKEVFFSDKMLQGWPQNGHAGIVNPQLMIPRFREMVIRTSVLSFNPLNNFYIFVKSFTVKLNIRDFEWNI